MKTILLSTYADIPVAIDSKLETILQRFLDMRPLVCFVLLMIFLPLCIHAQEVKKDAVELNNAKVIQLVGSGLSEDDVIKLINANGGKWELTGDAIAALDANKVSPKVIAAMITTSKPVVAAPAVESAIAVPEPAYHGFSIADLTTPFIGTGWLVTAHGTDYKILQSANTIEATGLGHKTPDFLLGVAFNTLFKPAFWQGRLNAKAGDRSYDPHLDAFVSLKFTPSSDNAINGVVLGGAVRIHPNLDLVVGMALTPQNAPSIGFRNADYLAVTGSPLPAQYAPFVGKTNDILRNANLAFDGFPLMTTGGQSLYPGDPLTTQYRNGIFVGVAFPVSLSNLFKPAQPSTPAPK